MATTAAPEPRPESAEGTLPVATGDKPSATDTLNFDPYVQGLYEFLVQADPPLTVSIEGPWGAGKSSFMLQLETLLRRDGNFTVYFNPWRHEAEEALWAAFILSFLEQVRGDLGYWKRVKANVRLIGLRSRAERSATLLRVGATLVVYALLVGAIWVGSGLFGVDPVTTAFGILGVSTLSGLALLSWVRQNVVMRTENQLRKYLSQSEYEEQVSFIHNFHEEFGQILDAYVGKSQPVYVFIDDLDRCVVPRAAELMQSINLMLSDDPRLVFVAGMDREKVAASIAAKHGGLLDELNWEDDPRFGLDYGYRFIEKFVQIPFQIPDPSDESIRTFIQGIVDPAEEEEVETVQGDQSTQTTEPANMETLVAGWTDERLGTVTTWVAPALRNNPRQIKRFANLFSLYALLAARVGFLADGSSESAPEVEEEAADEAEASSEPTLTIEQIGKFVAVKLRWRIVQYLERDIHLLDRLARIGLRRRYWTVANEVLAEELDRDLPDEETLDSELGKVEGFAVSSLPPKLRDPDELKHMLDVLFAGVYENEDEDENTDVVSDSAVRDPVVRDRRTDEIRHALSAYVGTLDGDITSATRKDDERGDPEAESEIEVRTDDAGTEGGGDGLESAEEVGYVVQTAERFFEEIDPDEVERLTGGKAEHSLTSVDLGPLLQLSPRIDVDPEPGVESEPEVESESLSEGPTKAAEHRVGYEGDFAETPFSEASEAYAAEGRRRASTLARTSSVLQGVRKTFFTKPRSPYRGVVVGLKVDDVESVLGKHHFEPGWDISFRFTGEVLNMRRVEHDPDRPFPGLDWWQTHVVGYEHPDGIELVAHFEVDPKEHPTEHVDRVGEDVVQGMDNLRSVLDREGIEYREVDADEPLDGADEEAPT